MCRHRSLAIGSTGARYNQPEQAQIGYRNATEPSRNGAGLADFGGETASFGQES